MELPISLREKINKKAEGKKQSELVEISKNISDRYINKSGQGKRLVTKNEEALVYSIARMPATYGAVATSLRWSLENFDEEIESVLDVGAGTGAASWAASEVFNNNLQITCLEREDAMINLGKEYMQDEVIPLTNAIWLKQDVANTEINQKADLVISSYMLNEFSEDARIKVVQKLWNATNKLLLIIEPGTPESFKKMKRIRERLISCGGNVIAPCVHNQNCKLSEDDWCQFTCRISRSKLHKVLKGGDSPFEDEKFFYLAISKNSKTSNEKIYSRVLRHPKIESGRITLKLCDTNGIYEKMITKKEKELFKEVRKIASGDLLNGGIKENGF